MAFDVMQSLFGLTPTAVGQALKAEEENRALTQARMLQGNPFAAGAYGALQSGERMLTGVRNLTGQVDPRMKIATDLRGVVQGLQNQGIDMATPEGMIQLASELNKNPDFAGMSVALRQQASKMQQEAKKSALSEQLTLSQIEENKAQAKKAAMPPKPEKVSREDRWTQLETKRLGEGLTKEEDNEYKALSRLLFKPEKGTEDTATARRWDLETKAAKDTLTAMGVDWSKPLTGRNAALPGIVDVYQKANRGPWGGREAPAPSPRTAPTPAQALSQRDQQALAWANANPNDPRAAEIKRRLGVK